MKDAEAVRARVLDVCALLQARIVLLDAVAIHGIVEEICEVREQVEQRPADEPVHLEHAARTIFAAEVSCDGAASYARRPGSDRLRRRDRDVRDDLIERELAGRSEVVPTAVQLDSVAVCCPTTGARKRHVTLSRR